MNCKDLERFSNNLTKNGYVLLNEMEIGLDAEVRSKITNKYFSNLEKDNPEVHSNRLRSREVLLFNRANDQFSFKQSDSIELVNRNYEGVRTYKRVNLLDDFDFSFLFKSLINICEPHKNINGSMGINLFRTYKVVTETRHRDFEDYVIIYCINKTGNGAFTQLTKDAVGKEIIFEASLKAGEILVFKDEPFYHYTTPLESDEPRDVVIITLGQLGCM